jgi:hypothetical protein
MTMVMTVHTPGSVTRSDLKTPEHRSCAVAPQTAFKRVTCDAVQRTVGKAVPIGPTKRTSCGYARTGATVLCLS